MAFKEPMAVCLGCGCDDAHACPGGCAWLRVDYKARAGVCSECEEHVARWDAGEREPYTAAGAA